MRPLYQTLWSSGLLIAMWAGSVAHAQVNIWQVGISDDGTVTATAASDHTGSVGTVVTMLNVGFNRKRGCRAELGFAVLKGATYGEPVGKQSPPRTEPIMLAVDGVQVSTPAPILVKYDNGFEAVFPADTLIVQALSSGTIARVRLVTGTPTFEFSISGARAAITQAQRQCAS
jgi:hypothetical protein